MVSVEFIHLLANVACTFQPMSNNRAVYNYKESSSLLRAGLNDWLSTQQAISLHGTYQLYHVPYWTSSYKEKKCYNAAPLK